ncbi:hypothetical protein ABFY09_08670 [Marinomonas sp. 5E14-1]
MFYRLNPGLPEWATKILQTILNSQKEWLKTNTEKLKSMENRPERLNEYC